MDEKKKYLTVAESCLAHLRGLKSYHERLMIPIRANANICQQKACPADVFGDTYLAALEEAIRCVKIVHNIP